MRRAELPAELRPIARWVRFGGYPISIFGWTIRTKGTQFCYGHPVQAWLKENGFTYVGGKWCLVNWEETPENTSEHEPT